MPKIRNNILPRLRRLPNLNSFQKATISQQITALNDGCVNILEGKPYKNSIGSYARTLWEEDFKNFTQKHLPDFAAHQDENYFELPNS